MLLTMLKMLTYLVKLTLWVKKITYLIKWKFSSISIINIIHEKNDVMTIKINKMIEEIGCDLWNLLLGSRFLSEMISKGKLNPY